MLIVTSKRLMLALVAAIAIAAVFVSAAASLAPIRREVLVVVYGKGKVTSTPRGITCPRTCTGYFPKDSRVHLTARPAAGWRLVHWTGKCTAKTPGCAFNLTTEHECSAQLCAVGAFGVHVVFVRR